MTPADGGGANATVAMVEGAAAALAPLAGPYGILADQLLTQGLNYWASFQARKTSGTLTMADLEEAAAKTSSDLEALKAAVDAQGAGA